MIQHLSTVNAVQNGGTGGTGGAVDVVDVLRGVISRWLMIVAFTVIGSVGAFFFVTTAEVQYTSTAKLIVQNLATPFTEVQQPNRADPGLQDTEIQSQVEVVNGRNLALDVIENRISPRARQLLERKATGGAKAVLARLGLGDPPSKRSKLQAALASYFKNLTVYRIERSAVIIVEYTATDPEVAAEIANAVADAYVASTQSAQAEPINEARKWLAEQIIDLREKVVASEVAVEEYRAEAGLIQGASTSLGNQELTELNSQMIVAASQRSEAEARARSIREMLANTGSVDNASDVVNSNFIQRLREQQVRLRRQLAELSATYLDNHPRILGVKRELADLDQQVRTEVFKVVNGLEQQAKIAANREAALRAQLAALKTKASETNVDEVKLRALQREAVANRTLLETFLTRYNDASTREKPAYQPGLARVISVAAVPLEPSFPKKVPIIALGTIAGLVLGAGLAFLLEVMAATARAQRVASLAAAPVPVAPEQPALQQIAPQQAAHPASGYPPAAKPFRPQTGFDANPSLAVLPPVFNLNAARAFSSQVASHPASAQAAAVSAISGWVDRARNAAGCSRIAVTCLPGSELDAAVVTLATARQLAGKNIRVVAVDADLATGVLARVAGANPGAGLLELTARKAGFSEVVTCDPESMAHVIAARAVLDLQTALDEERFIAALDALEKAYDVVLINTGAAQFPANRHQVALTSGQACLVVSSANHAGPAAALLNALRAGGQRLTGYVAIDTSTSSENVSGMAV